jgi:ribosomal protein L11 methyltransferase
MKKYKDFLITADPFNSELLSSILWELNITGISEDVNCLHVYAEIESNINAEIISRQLSKLQSENLLDEFTVEEAVVEERNWNEEFEKSLKVIQVTEKIVVKPSSRNYEKKEGEIVITIDPKMSFGTGEHQTTKLVLQLLEKYLRRDVKVLDAGSGTGILSIAAVKLGAGNAIGFDNDEWCFENAKENSVNNNVNENVEIRIGDISVITENDFDIILANIQKNILIELSENFAGRLKKDGIILLSGLLKEDEADIVSLYSSKGFRHLETRQMDEWAAFAFIKS